MRVEFARGGRGWLWVKSACAARSSSVTHLPSEGIESLCHGGLDMAVFIMIKPIHSLFDAARLTHMAELAARQLS